MPAYLKIMGAEFFGLIGIFIALQAFIQTSDLGLSSAIMREASRLIAGKTNKTHFNNHLRAVEWVISIIALSAILITIALSGYIEEIFQKHAETTTNIKLIIILMMLASLPKLGSGVYKNALIGFEKQQKSNIISVIFATFRYAGVIPLISLLPSKGVAFFSFQAAVSFAELCTFAWVAYASISTTRNISKPNFGYLKDLWPVAAPMAFLSMAWVILTNFDRIILAKILEPTEYGYFSLAAIGAAGILTFITPLSQILLPRMTILSEHNKTIELIDLFRVSTQIITAFFLSLGGTLFTFSAYAIYAWTGSLEVTNNSALIFGWYSLANAIAGILYLPFVLQFSHGSLHLHFWGNILSIGIQIPAILWAASYFGAYGVVLTILTVRIIFLFYWTPLIFNRITPQITYSWLLKDVLPSGVLALLFLYIIHSSLPQPENRVEAALIIITGFMTTFFATILTLNNPRKILIRSAASMLHKKTS